jgi:hypothetical protein
MMSRIQSRSLPAASLLLKRRMGKTPFGRKKMIYALPGTKSSAGIFHQLSFNEKPVPVTNPHNVLFVKLCKRFKLG